jgi:uncharacterized protein YkwD
MITTRLRAPARLLALVGAAGLAVVPAAASGSPAPDPGAAPSTACADVSAGAPAAVQQSVMRCLINRERRARGLPTLSPSPVLARAAARKNALMVRCDQFEHDACGQAWYGVFVQAGYHGSVRGENIAWASASIASPREVLQMWLHSPPHRANLLSPLWTDQAVSLRVAASFQGEAGAHVWTSQFGRRAAVAAGR